MEELRHRKNIDQLLHDKSFILWCLFPTEESDKQWKENYLSLYPEEAETLMLARRFADLNSTTYDLPLRKRLH